MLLDVHGMHRLLTLAESGSAKSINPFIYNPFRPVSPPGTASAMLYLLANQAGVIDAGLLEGVAMARRLIWADHVQVKVKGGEQTVVPASEAGSVCWVCGEVAAVEVEIRNPTVIPIKVSHFRGGLPSIISHAKQSSLISSSQIRHVLPLVPSSGAPVLSKAAFCAQVERLNLEVAWAGHPSVAPADQNLTTAAKWKPNSVAIYLPPETPATKVWDPCAVDTYKRIHPDVNKAWFGAQGALPSSCLYRCC